jgi:RND family efflux transporter MFP subunit
MRRHLGTIVILLAVAGAAGCSRDDGNGGNPSSAGGRGGPGMGARPPMPVEFTTVKRAPVAEQVLVVGNLIGAATVEIVPRVNGRLQDVSVRLGDPVRRGQLIAKVEDREIQEQVRQQEAAFKVSQASIRQREADLTLAKTNLDRSKSLYERQLLPQQTFDDTQARFEAALAQVDLAKAQFEQSKARLDELKINLSNTEIVSPVDGFVGKRYLDPGAFTGNNAPVAAVVDIRTVRLVANLVERDVKRVRVGTPGRVEVDAFPGEVFSGKVSRVAPVFDPSTRTAEMEIEVPNGGFRLKPGMYARVSLTIDTRANALTLPRNAIVDVEGKTGVFVAGPPPPSPQGSSGQQAGGDAKVMSAKFQPVSTGIRDGEHVEIVAGLQEGAQVITSGAGALKDGDRIVPATPAGTGRRGRAGERANGQGERPGGAGTSGAGRGEEANR